MNTMWRKGFGMGNEGRHSVKTVVCPLFALCPLFATTGGVFTLMLASLLI